jgi:transcriptional regulator with XRE-family HTH domain
MSANGYGNIERGNSNINMIKLKKIAALLDENLLALFGGDQNVFNSIGDNNTGTQSNQNFCSLFSDDDQCPRNDQIECSLAKQKLITTQQESEISILKQLNEQLEAKIESEKL